MKEGAEPPRHSSLERVAPDLERILLRGYENAPLFAVSEIECMTVSVTMRDGVRLATDVYRPPVNVAPCVLVRTPYGRGMDRFVGTYLSLARRGYVVVSQDCRGTGDSEPDSWDYYIYEADDSIDFVEWVSRQDWCDGFLGACGGSYVGQTQWCMALHPRMSTIVPQVSGLGIAFNTVHLHMFANAYARSVGKGGGKVPIHYTELERAMADETLASGYFNEGLHRPFSEQLLERYPELHRQSPSAAKAWLWRHYCALPSAQRAEFVKQALDTDCVTFVDIESLPSIFGHRISHDALTIPHPDSSELCRMLHAPPLVVTGWYDWGLNDTLATWEALRRQASEAVSTRSRLIITPGAHNMPGYHEGMADHPELQHNHSTLNNVGLLMRWYSAVREDTTDSWPTVIYYLMGANEWHVAADWPPPKARRLVLYLNTGGALSSQLGQHAAQPSRYTYDPQNPTPTIGGSIVSYVYPPGSVDVSKVQNREDVLTYTTAPLGDYLDVVGPLNFILYASSSAVDTDFSVRLSDVFPDGRAIQLQTGILRARYRNIEGDPELLEPGRVYRFEIDMWATANRFKTGHRVRVDISSADFPRFDRNTNLGGEAGLPTPALQSVYHDHERPSHILLSVLGGRHDDMEI